MRSRSIIRTIVGLSLSGVLFAGYLSGTKLFTGTCALNESCPYFLGYPACWYGFAMFLTLFLVSLMAMFGRMKRRIATKVLVGVSTLGLLFSGSFAVQEIMGWMEFGKPDYALGLPTCMYGLVFYILVLIFSVVLCRKEKAKEKMGEKKPDDTSPASMA